MKSPVIRIKKDAIVYDDTAALRVSELPRPALPGSGPFFSRRRGRPRGRLTFFPLAVIAVGMFLVFQVVPNIPVSRAVLSGWQVTLHVTPYADRFIVGLTFIATPGAGGAVRAGQVGVQASIPGTGAQVLIDGVLDRSPMTLRGELPRLASAKRVRAVVSIGSARAILWIPAPLR